jgi:hypothetical protein
MLIFKRFKRAIPLPLLRILHYYCTPALPVGIGGEGTYPYLKRKMATCAEVILLIVIVILICRLARPG